MSLSVFQKVLLLVFLFGTACCLSVPYKQQKSKEFIKAYETLPEIKSSASLIHPSTMLINEGNTPENCAGDYQFSPQFLLFLE